MSHLFRWRLPDRALLVVFKTGSVLQAHLRSSSAGHRGLVLFTLTAENGDHAVLARAEEAPDADNKTVTLPDLSARTSSTAPILDCSGS
jgi:hypothetical protein